MNISFNGFVCFFGCEVVGEVFNKKNNRWKKVNTKTYPKNFTKKRYFCMIITTKTPY